MDEIRCPGCGTEDIHGRPGAEGTITLSCDECGTEWTRQPRASCPRCGKPDPSVREFWGWSFDDNDAARDDPMADYDDVLWAEYRCWKCHLSWRRELDRRPGRGGKGAGQP
jgi:DNA-directed RNA polymerase subunit RPC12/RpoP